MTGKHILDVTCGTRSIWFGKNNEATVYCDKRREEYDEIWTSTKNPSIRHSVIDPDVQCDFTDLPFEDESFEMVVYDPPHVENLSSTSWLGKRYGSLESGWEEMIRKGFEECMRVLKPYGTLIFKWSEIRIPTRKVIDIIGVEPLFGHRSGKKMNTHWMTFMKGVSDIE